jgi:hypothetical protein
MHKFVFALVVLGALGLADAALARGLGEAGEAEAARMHAKAGGPTNDRDRWLLRTYGCRDKKDSEYCWYLYKSQRGSLWHAKKYRWY